LDRHILPETARLQLVGHRGGRSEDELWGLLSDLEDAFGDNAPSIELVVDPQAVDADVVVMLAGVTIPTDPHASVDRAALGQANYRIFLAYADALAARPGQPPTVIVQSNPVELGVQVFAERLGRQHVLGAGGWSDTLRLRAELAAELAVRRPRVHAWILGQHGDHLVPIWSQVRAWGVTPAEVAALVARVTAGRPLAGLPDEVRLHKAQMIDLVRSGQVRAAYDRVQALPPDLRAAVKPFFTHFTAGHTTEVVTAYAVADIVAALVEGRQRVFPAQVALEGEWLGVHGVVGAPVVLSLNGWEHLYPVELSDVESAAVERAAAAIAAANAGVAQSISSGSTAAGPA
jgi:malate dehydrogenase